MVDDPKVEKKSLDDYMLSKDFYERELPHTLRNPDISLLPTPADHNKEGSYKEGPRDWWTGQPKAPNV